MSFRRVLPSAAAVLAIAGCVVVAVGMSRAVGSEPAASPSTAVSTDDSSTSYGYLRQLPLAASTDDSTSTPSASTTTAAKPAPPATRSTTPVPNASSTYLPQSAAPPPAAKPPAAQPPATTTAVKAAKPAPVTGRALPLDYSTGSATRVITVVARSTGSTTATVQAWDKAPGGGWLPRGSAISAYIGSDGMTPTPSESRSATPMGSFTLTQAFGSYENPGTGLPYFQTTPDDYWISDAGARYNTHQRCSSCGYNDGINERLLYAQPYYRYAVVIDYNTPNAGVVRQGAGSAFFLHVANGAPTAGCVAIAQSSLVPLMKWLTPSAHPRILIGTG